MHSEKKILDTKCKDIDKIVADIRLQCALAVEIAQSGHPGSALGLSPFCHLLFSEFLQFDPDDSKWLNRDIFILSNGHVCPIQYVMNILRGYITMNDLKEFRKIHSLTPGHPEYGMPGVDATSEPLGQGVATAVGFAIALTKMKEYNKEAEIFNNQVYCIFGDGCYQEGITQEAFSLAALYKLNNLTFIYDYNKMTIDGSTEISMDENVEMRFEALGFEVINIKDGNTNINGMREALNKKTDKTKMIILNTTIGMGCGWAGENRVHGEPIGKENIENMKRKYNLKEFEFSNETAKYYENTREKMRIKRKEWNDLSRNLEIKPKVKKVDLEKIITNLHLTAKSTRKHFGDAINEMIDYAEFIGGSADLTPSTNTKAKNVEEYTKFNRNGSFLRFGIREHGMFAVMNGIASYGVHLPFTGTFLNFITYGFPSTRLAALGNLHLFYIFTHDSIGLGEDGPTHQPIEALPLIRATPNLVCMRPCDGLETRVALWWAINNPMPSCICLSRQEVPLVDSTIDAKFGAYAISQVKTPSYILLASGSEVVISIAAKEILSKKGIEGNVVSFMSFEIFEMQSDDYKNSIMLDCLRISVEAASTFGWSRYAHKSIGIDRFGLSGKCEDLYDYFGFTPEKIAEKVEKWLEEKK
ncbi:Transketolase [Spraguea lophii 42_110]|uniref:transketolase n=1 Tax=Spraguea lophii (strain 42_110) TaxID=1358809 RepID=S7WCK9_SPRLO|nr:Transketolase [Spraguea lophii 42_110]